MVSAVVAQYHIRGFVSPFAEGAGLRFTVRGCVYIYIRVRQKSRIWVDLGGFWEILGDFVGFWVIWWDFGGFGWILMDLGILVKLNKSDAF